MRPVDELALVLVAVAPVLSVPQDAFPAVTAEPFLVAAPPAVAWPVRHVRPAAEAALVAVLLRGAPGRDGTVRGVRE